ncbi:MAG: phosphopyruvate hydratase [bacterium]
MKITDITAIQILDSRGNPTIKASVQVGTVAGDFSVPSGASTGTFEALELRDHKKGFSGLGVEKAIQNIDTLIKPALIGMEITNQKAIDGKMISLDGTANKSKLGANAILGVSGAVARAAAKSLNLPLYRYLKNIYEQNGVWEPSVRMDKYSYKLPKMFFNILNGGKHAENQLDIQETMIVPQDDKASENVRIGSEVYHCLKEIVKGRNLSTGLGDEGGFAPDLESNTKALDLVAEAIEKAGYKLGKDVCMALDVAASEIYDPNTDEKYILASENIGLSAMQMVSLYKDLVANYQVISIEDGLAEEDWDGWQMMTERIGKEVQLIGDDLFVTNVERIKKGIELNAGNSVLIKMNQIGTLTETFEAIRLALKNNYKIMISHRSGETDDSFIADLSVAVNAGQIKSGAPARGERTSKYNRLIEIEKEIAR